MDQIFKVDYILTHTMPQSLLKPVIGEYYCPDPTRKYFDQIYEQVNFNRWFCGYFHREIDKPEYRIRVIYKDIVLAETGK